MFTKIIANPPYGSKSSLSKKIVNTLLENKVAKEMVVLAPSKTFYGVLDYSKELKCVSSYLNKTVIFEDAAVETLFLDHIVSEKQNKYKEPSDFLLDEKHKVFRNAVIEYNSSREPFYVTAHGYCTPKRKEALKDVNEDLLFVVPLWCAGDKVHKGNNAEDARHNLLGQPINWRTPSSIYAIQFDDPVKLQNSKNWWYRVPGRGVDAQRTLIYFILDLLCEAYNGSPSIKKYVWFLPNVDWSHPWTDQEILAELNLPTNFLES